MKSQHTRAIRPAHVAACATAVVAICVAGVVLHPDRRLQSGLEIGSDASDLNLSLVTIPEPGALVSLLGGAGVLIGIQRFRRRSK